LPEAETVSAVSAKGQGHEVPSKARPRDTAVAVPKEKTLKAVEGPDEIAVGEVAVRASQMRIGITI
jgi:hypothetical protein